MQIHHSAIGARVLSFHTCELWIVQCTVHVFILMLPAIESKSYAKFKSWCDLAVAHAIFFSLSFRSIKFNRHTHTPAQHIWIQRRLHHYNTLQAYHPFRLLLYCFDSVSLASLLYFTFALFPTRTSKISDFWRRITKQKSFCKLPRFFIHLVLPSCVEQRCVGANFAHSVNAIRTIRTQPSAYKHHVRTTRTITSNSRQAADERTYRS